MLKAAKNMRGKLALLYRVTGRPGHRLHIFLNSTYERICAAAHICSIAKQTPQLALYQTYYNFCLPHASLRQALPQPEPTKGTGSATQWRPCTPAMAAGLTDHVWTLREVLLYRVPPWPQPAGVCASRVVGNGNRRGPEGRRMPAWPASRASSRCRGL